MSSQSFAKTRRVRRSGDYQRAFQAGRRVHGRFFTLIVAPNGASTPRLGIVASRKVGNAVVRNRVKRLIREVFRRTVDSGASLGVDLIVIPKPGFLDVSYDTLQKDFNGTFRRGIGRLDVT